MCKLIGIGKTGINKIIMVLREIIAEKADKIEVKQIQFAIWKQKLNENATMPVGVIKAILAKRGESVGSH